MDYYKMFVENNIITINDLFNFQKHKIEYGWIDQDDNKHEGVNDAKSYSLQYPEELLFNKIGICWDMTELARCFFKNMTNLSFETYYLFYDDNKGCPSHSILVYYKDNKVYWFEPMYNDEIYYYSGIHEYDSIEELLKDFKLRFIENGVLKKYIPDKYEESKFYLHKYEQPSYHINGHEMREHIDNSILIKI